MTFFKSFVGLIINDYDLCVWRTGYKLLYQPAWWIWYSAWPIKLFVTIHTHTHTHSHLTRYIGETNVNKLLSNTWRFISCKHQMLYLHKNLIFIFFENQKQIPSVDNKRMQLCEVTVRFEVNSYCVDIHFR